MLKILELFTSSKSISKAWEELYHKVFIELYIIKYHNPITDQYAIKDGKYWIATIQVGPIKETHRYKNLKTLLDLWFFTYDGKTQCIAKC